MGKMRWRGWRKSAADAPVSFLMGDNLRDTGVRNQTRGRFQVIERSRFFAVRDTQTGRECPLPSGVDVLMGLNGEIVFPGTPGFCECWAEILNADEGWTLATYFS